ncbi:MAG TPA: hypothetical protein VGR14_08675 [Verrucomicrobiae bacterium]|jgi:hypothetical protein|nr:hypothetical protein [Verrucomicrobiae bacterium]
MRRLYLLVFVALACSASAQTNSYDPESAYTPRQIEGWRILVNQKLLAETNLCDRTIKVLSMQLFQITRVVPEPALAKIRQIPIWVELNDPLFPGMCFHPSRDWLATHGVNPAKTGAVELANATNFVSWSLEQPCMVLHELAHGYHHLVLGDDDPRVIRCYQHAQATGLYASILRINGHHERAYAMTNEKEYFAESTEAFFGTNDFYPFVRAELKEYDPDMFALLCEVWGVKP